MFGICCLQARANGQVLRIDVPTFPFHDRDQADRIIKFMNDRAEPGMEYHVYEVR